MKQLGKADPFTEPVSKGSKTMYRARFAGLAQGDAEAACKALKRSDAGLFSGRQIHSPAPFHICRPSLSWISVRQSLAMRRSFSPVWNMLVSGAMPRRLTRSRRNTRDSTSTVVSLPGRKVNL